MFMYMQLFISKTLCTNITLTYIYYLFAYVCTVGRAHVDVLLSPAAPPQINERAVWGHEKKGKWAVSVNKCYIVSYI